MLTILKDVKRLSTIRNDVTLKLSTNVNAAGLRFQARITFSNGDIQQAVEGATIIFAWNSGSNLYQFTCSSAGGEGKYFPRSNYVNDSQFLDALIGIMSATQAFVQFFELERVGITNTILLTARFVGLIYNTAIGGTQPFSKEIVLLGANPAPEYNIYMDIFEETILHSNEFRRIIGLKLYPDESREFDLNLKRILENPEMLPEKISPAIPPDYAATPRPASSFIKRFFYKISEITTGPDLGTGSRITSEVKYLLLAGINNEAVLKEFDIESHLLQEYTPFLTWWPNGKLIAKDQPDFLYFLLIDPSKFRAGRPTKVVVDIIFSDGSSLVNKEITDITAFELWQPVIIPTGIFQMGLQSFIPDESTLISEYSVYVTHDGMRISEKKTYRVDWRCPEDRQFFLFQNSLGGMDVLYCQGLELAYNMDEIIAERVKRDDFIDNYATGQYFISSKIGQRSFRTFTNISDKVFLAYLQDFFNSRWVYLISQGRYIPVLLTKSSGDIFKQRPDLQAIPIDYRYAFDDSSYTPA